MWVKFHPSSGCGSGDVFLPDCVTTAADAIQALTSNGALTSDAASICHLEQNSKRVEAGTVLDGQATLHVVLGGGLPGGKGGFGSMLRSIGAQIERTTNHEAMRDLSGRRQRDVNNEKRLKNYVEKQAEREREAAERKEKKLEKLKRLANGENKAKYDFSDPVYDQVRSETEEKVHSAVEAAMASSSTAGGSSATGGTGGSAAAGKPDLKRKSTEEAVAPKKAKGLWIGEGLDDLSDLDDSDDSDSETEKKTTAVAV